jgi:putative aldouronate transport system substrate-binding protein
MKQGKRILTILIVVMCMIFVSGYALSAQKPEKKSKVRIFTQVTGGKTGEEMKEFEKALSNETGFDVIMEKPATDYANVLIQKLQGGEKFDLIYLNMPQYLNLVEQGALLNLTGFVKTSKIYSNPSLISRQELKDITVKGKIYAGFNKKELHKMVLLNRIHLQEAGIDYTKIKPTLAGYYQVFKKLKATIKTPNYYPFNCVMKDINDLEPWLASVGLKSGVMKDKRGKKYVPLSTKAATPVWTWMAKLYKEGLIDPAASVDETKDLRAKLGASSQLTSVAVDWAAWLGLQNSNAEGAGIKAGKYDIVGLPGTKTPKGGYMLTKGAASLWAIPVNASNPEGAKKIIEFFATQEGGDLLTIGIPGVDYNVKKGRYVLTDLGVDHGCDHGATIPILETYKSPVEYPRGFASTLNYLKYASIEMPISNDLDYREVCGKWGVQIMQGKVSVATGLANMRKELVSRKVTDY